VQGLRAYRKGQFTKAVSFLEKAVREKRDDYQAYLYLGYSSLRTDDLEGALKYFKSGLLIRDDDVDLMKGLAYVYLKHERLEDAIGLWGEVLARKPSERNVKRLLERLRGAQDVNNFIENADMKDFLSLKAPVFTRLRPYLIGISITAGVIVVGVVFYATPLYKKALERFYPDVVKLREVTLPTDSPALQQDAKGVLYSLSEREIGESFARIKRYIYKGKANTAILALNKIMMSNASPPVKEKFRLLYTFIDPPDPLSIDYIPRYYEIVQEPSVYEGAFVLWSGRIAGIAREKDKAEFDLLVSYKNQDTVEGIAHVAVEGTYYLENRQAVEVFGVYRGYDRKTGKLLVQGILVRDLRI
jgi:tetratricopeptide (TPR) repeat protein